MHTSIKINLFFLISLFISLSFGSCKKSVQSVQSVQSAIIDSTDSIVGTYFGNIHYTTDNYMGMPGSHGIHTDTTYSFNLIVTKISYGIFATNRLDFWDSNDGNFHYTSSNVYIDACYNPHNMRQFLGNTLKFDPSSGTATYNIRNSSSYGKLNEEETFSGRKH